jgi:hypothetical protein
LSKIRKIPLRLMNRPTAHATVIGSCATWHCACGNPIALQGKSGPATGPTQESAVVCDRCARAYFVIPMDRSFGPPIEVVELFGAPEAAPPSDAPTSESVRQTSASNLTAL